MLDDLSTMSFGAWCDMGGFTVLAGYEKAEYTTLERTLMTIGVRAALGPGQLNTSYTKASGTGAVATPQQCDATLLRPGYDYRMFKRTVIYANYANYGRIDNGGNSTTGASFTASANRPAGIERGESSTGYQLGRRPNF